MSWFSQLVNRAVGSLRLGRALRMVWEASRGWSILSFALVTIQAVVPLGVLYLTKLIVDAVAAGVAGEEAPGFEYILLLIGLAAGLGLVSSAVGAILGLVREAQGHVVTDHVLTMLHRKSIGADLGYYEDPTYHDTLHRAQQEAPYRPTGVLNSLMGLAKNGMTAVGVAVLLATVHWLLTLLLMLAVLPAVIVRVRYADRTYRWQERRAAMERKSGYLSWLLVNPLPAKEIRTFGLGETLIRRFRKIRDLLRKEKIALSRSRTIGDVAAQTVGAAAVFGSYAFIAYRTTQGVLTLGDLVMYFATVQKGLSVLQSLFTSLAKLYEDNLFLATLDDFLSVEPRVTGPPDSRPFPAPMREGIRFENVSFNYPASTRTLLKGVDLTIGPGEVVAIVGPNGAGKTTLVKLLARLYDPTEGAITVDGVDMRQMDPGEIRKQMTVVFQDYMRYAFSVRDNIWFGDVDRATDDSGIERAADAAGAHPVIQSLRAGYDSMLGPLFPGGEELSIGEWQKVALARAFFRQAQLLVVDEPTSALDATAEAELFSVLGKLLRGRSALIVSHRFSTVRMCDRIYVLDQGQVVEEGSHEELMGRRGMYARLYSTQADMYGDGATGVHVGGPGERRG